MVLNTAIVGYGYMGKLHASVMQKLPGYQVQVVCEPDTGKVNGDTPTYGSVDELLSAHRPDLAVVATPVETHYDILRKLVGKNIPVLMEKPICGTGEEAGLIERLVQDQSRNSRGPRVVVGYLVRHSPVIEKARDIMADMGLVPVRYTAVWVKDRRQDVREHIGVVRADATHPLDVMLYQLLPYGSAITPKNVKLVYDQDSQIETEATIELLGMTPFETPIRMTTFASFNKDVKVRSITLRCKAPYSDLLYVLRLDFDQDHQGSIVDSLHEGWEGTPLENAKSWSVAVNRLELELEAVREWVLDETYVPSLCSVEQALENVLLADDIVRLGQSD